MPSKKNLTAISRALAEISFAWLNDNHPTLAEAIEIEVDRGAKPQQIRRFVMQRTERRELALRCEQAAAWLTEME